MKHFKTQYQFTKFVKGLSISFVAWFLLHVLYLCIRFDALVSYNQFLGLTIPSNSLLNQNEVGLGIVVSIALSSVLSLFSWNFYFFLSKRSEYNVWKRVTRMVVLLGLLFTCFYFTVDFLAKEVYDKHDYDPIKVFTHRSFIVYFIYLGIGDVLIYSLFHLRDILGPEMFSSVLQGKYANPQEEHRIFMFMDMYNSTSIAEKLGHLNYSRFLQECYEIMTDAIVYHKASIYQYIGDEIVFTWRSEKGIANNHCTELYFDIKKLLDSNASHFMSTYGVVPEFKAGLHIGIVTAVQVGVIKRELAYHGDVLNTAARLQEKCKLLNTSILVSEDLQEELDYKFREKGKYFFRGKSVPTSIYTIDQTP